MNQPRQILKYAAVTAVSLLALAACGNGSDAGAGALVSTREIDGLGTVLVGGDGKTLYTTEAEAGGNVKCVDACTEFWPPLTTDQASVAESVSGVTGKLGVITRPDKTKQVTLDGLPLYNFAEDRAPGAAKGDGFEDDFQGTHFVWQAATADGTKAKPTQDGDDSGGGYDYGY